MGLYPYWNPKSAILICLSPFVHVLGSLNKKNKGKEKWLCTRVWVLCSGAFPNMGSASPLQSIRCGFRSTMSDPIVHLLHPFDTLLLVYEATANNEENQHGNTYLPAPPHWGFIGNNVAQRCGVLCDEEEGICDSFGSYLWVGSRRLEVPPSRVAGGHRMWWPVVEVGVEVGRRVLNVEVGRRVLDDGRQRFYCFVWVGMETVNLSFSLLWLIG